MEVDWESDETHLLLNPREQNVSLNQFPHMPAHIWLATSGTTSSARKKYLSLSKSAFLHSAQAVNEHLGSNRNDIWAHALPNFHVGGLGIYARAYLSGATVISAVKNEKWDPGHFHSAVVNLSATLSALVPTQVYDLIELGLEAPPNLRALIVGGGHLSDHLYRQATQLNWPLLPSYGLSECASQVATAKLGDRSLYILPHVKVSTYPDGQLKIASAALLSCYAFVDDEVEIIDPKVNGWFCTGDFSKISGDRLIYLGRFDDVYKVSGEKINLFELNQVLDVVKNKEPCYLTIKQDIRLGHRIVLVAEDSVDVDLIIKSYNHRVLPFERIRQVHRMELEKTALQKIIKKVL